MARRRTPLNALVWRMNPRRLDVEAWRDSLLRVTGRLNDKMYGPSEDVDSDNNVRRTVYARVSRGRVSKLFRLYDFPDATQTAPSRDLTTSSLQQLFVMNSSFMQENAAALARSLQADGDTPRRRANCSAKSSAVIRARKNWTSR